MTRAFNLNIAFFLFKVFIQPQIEIKFVVALHDIMHLLDCSLSDIISCEKLGSQSEAEVLVADEGRADVRFSMGPTWVHSVVTL